MHILTVIKHRFLSFIAKLFYLSKSNIWESDSPRAYQISLQEPGSSYMEGLQIFNCQLLLIITAIVVLVSILLYATLETTLEHLNSFSSNKFAHSHLLEIFWTSVPALILLSIASPSFSLLFSMDEVAQPDLTLKVFGHQWYWSYEMSDFNSCINSKSLRYTAYMLSKDNLIEENVPGLFRNLETTRRIVLPTNTHIRLLVTSVDVLHSWAVPSLGIKVDACPGRLNLVSLYLKRSGLFYGQCSEICGINHGFMPIALVSLHKIEFFNLVLEVVQPLQDMANQTEFDEKNLDNTVVNSTSNQGGLISSFWDLLFQVWDFLTDIKPHPDVDETLRIHEMCAEEFIVRLVKERNEVLNTYSRKELDKCMDLVKLFGFRPNEDIYSEVNYYLSEMSDSDRNLCIQLIKNLQEAEIIAKKRINAEVNYELTSNHIINAIREAEEVVSNETGESFLEAIAKRKQI